MADNQTTCALIGGSPSTGSSLLVNVLHRHSGICAGPETYLFMHPALYADWESKKYQLLRPHKLWGLKSVGWFRKNGADLLLPEYGWTRPELSQLIRTSATFRDFAGEYFSRFQERSRADLWVEKSPSNALTLLEFLDTFPVAKVVHTCRDPYDTVASLVARGMNPFQACSSYLVNTAFALKVLGHERASLLRYEDWVLEPALGLPRLVHFLGFDWEPSVLEPGQAERQQQVRMPGWEQNEKGPIQASSVGRFQRLEVATQRLIRETFSLISLDEAYAHAHNLPVITLGEICRTLQYSFQEVTLSRATRAVVGKWKAQDQWFRLLHAYPTGWKQYPIDLSA